MHNSGTIPGALFYVTEFIVCCSRRLTMAEILADAWANNIQSTCMQPEFKTKQEKIGWHDSNIAGNRRSSYCFKQRHIILRKQPSVNLYTATV